MRRALAGACDVCGTEAEYDGDWLVECDRCRVLVHMGCYGVAQHPAGAPWLCSVCRLPGVGAPPPCALCPRVGGAMKPTDDGRWCHLLCCTWMPGVAVADPAAMEPIIGVGALPAARLALTCGVCRQRHGACIQCAGSGRCYAAFHATCAREAGYRMGVQAGDSGGGGGGGDGGGGTGAAADADGGGDNSGSDDDGDGGGEQQQQAQQQPAQGKKRGRPKKGGGAKKKGGGGGGADRGTTAGGLCRLLCFCPKHRDAEPPGGRVVAIHAAGPGGDAAAAAAAAATPRSAAAAAAGGAAAAADAPLLLPFGLGGTGGAGGGGGGGGGTLPGGKQHAATAAAVSAPAAALLSPGRVAAISTMAAHAPPDGTCARSRLADVALRRGLRAPEAREAALRKRLYVRRVPYLVVRRPPREGRPLLPPPARGARFDGPEFEADRLAHSGAAVQPQQQQSQQQQQQQFQQQQHWQHQQPPPAGRPLSQAERFARMVATTPDRVAAGKSAIHGWGAFAKSAHRAGDMVVEYAGWLLRPSAADALERRHYDSVVGAGAFCGRRPAGSRGRFLSRAGPAASACLLVAPALSNQPPQTSKTQTPAQHTTNHTTRSKQARTSSASTRRRASTRRSPAPSRTCSTTRARRAATAARSRSRTPTARAATTSSSSRAATSRRARS